MCQIRYLDDGVSIYSAVKVDDFCTDSEANNKLALLMVMLARKFGKLKIKVFAHCTSIVIKLDYV